MSTVVAKPGDLEPEAVLRLPPFRVPVILIVVAVPLSAASMPVGTPLTAGTIETTGELLSDTRAA